MWNNDWKKNEDYPSWGDTDVYKKTIAGGYLVGDECLYACSYNCSEAFKSSRTS
jgi:hypothetical protein